MMLKLGFNSRTASWCTVLIISACYTFQVKAAGYPFCNDRTPHTITQLNNTGVITFDKQDRLDISCSVGLSYDSDSLYMIKLYYSTACFNFAFDEIPIRIQIDNLTMRFNSNDKEYSRTLDDSGLTTLKVYGENQPPAESFELRYIAGEYRHSSFQSVSKATFSHS